MNALAHNKVDQLQVALADLPQLDLPLTHTFTPHLYTRTITMPKGAVVISKIHKTEHPFIISKGCAVVWTEDDGVVKLSAPHIGVTKAGTRRILYIPEDCVWSTFHVTDETDLSKIEEQIILKRDVGSVEVTQEVQNIVFQLKIAA